LQSKCNRATIKDLVYANQAIDEAGEHSNQGIIYKSDAINWKNCSIVTVSDASWSNEDEQVKKKVQKYKSQRARMTILVNPDFPKKEESAFHVISWQSTIIRRICRNTLQAETYGVNFAIEEGMRLRALIADHSRTGKPRAEASDNTFGSQIANRWKNISRVIQWERSMTSVYRSTYKCYANSFGKMQTKKNKMN